MDLTGKKSSKGLPGNVRAACAVAIIKKLQDAVHGMVFPAVTTIVNEYGKDPFLVLISCLLSLRTKDTISLPASKKLFLHAKTAETMLALPLSLIEHIIYPVGFYRQKAKQIHQICADLLNRFNGIVPDNEQDLLSLKGVGRKTANLVLAQGFDIPAICVDTHVHRISNRLGLVDTKTPKETEDALKEILPKEYWSIYNQLLVTWGQNICVPVSPWCSLCPIARLCAKKNVTKHR